jgi:hypothetical protein
MDGEQDVDIQPRIIVQASFLFAGLVNSAGA